MKHKLTLLLSLVVMTSMFLAACGAPATATNTPFPPTATATEAPTAEATVTPTEIAIPTIQVGELSVPDLRVSNPELFDLKSPDAPIPQFVNAMQMAGIETTGEQVAQGVTYQELKDKDGNPFIVATYNLDPDPNQTGETLEGPIPLFIGEKNGEDWVFNKIGRNYTAKAGLSLGVELTGYWFDNPEWQKIVTSNFNLGVLAWGTSWSEIEPTRGCFNFDVFDKHYAFLNKNKMVARGGILHPAAIPDWLKNGKFSSNELTEILREHITATVGRHKGDIKEWIVINEPYIDLYRTDDIFYQTLGEDYIDSVFQFARSADPEAILIYNDSDNHSWSGTTTHLTKKIVTRLKEKNLIDGVGLQMHLDGAHPPKKEDVIKTMQDYGVSVYITEFDVDMRDVSGSQEEKNRIQAGIYKEMVSACLESGVCPEFTTWEAGDKFSWLEYPPQNSYTSPEANPTMYNDSLEPKFALYGLLQAIHNHISAHQ